jgi:hypothetical protein
MGKIKPTSRGNLVSQVLRSRRSVKLRTKITSAFEWNGLGIETVIMILQNYGTVSVASDM